MGAGWSNIWVISLIFIVCAIAAVITYRIMKEELVKQQEYEKAGMSPQEELQRSLEYEQKSIRSNVTSMTWIYIVAIALSVAAFIFYMFL